MTPFELNPPILLAVFGFALFLGFAVLAYANKSASVRIAWSVVTFFVALFGLAVYGFWQISAIGSGQGLTALPSRKVSIWKWFEIQSSVGPVELGLFLDPIGMAMLAVVAFCSILVLVNRSQIMKEPRPERIYAVFPILAVGVGLAWSAATVWTAIISIFLTMVAIVLFFGSRWNENQEEAIYSFRFMWESSLGLLVAVIGCCILASVGTEMKWHDELVWYPYISLQIGAWILAIGLYIQTRPFPFLRLNVMSNRSIASARILATQVFLAWAAFACLFRLERQLRAVGVFPTIGWIALLAALFTMGAALMQRSWEKAIFFWTSAMFSVGMCALAFSGPWSSFAIILGGGLSSVSIAFARIALDCSGGDHSTGRKKAKWAKMGLVFSTLSATGCIGFVSASGGLSLVRSSYEDIFQLIAVSLLFFGLALLGGKSLWGILKQSRSVNADWWLIATPYLLSICTLGVLWTGSLSGSVLPNEMDRVIPSAFELFFGNSTLGIQVWDKETAYIIGSWLYWGSVLTGVLFSYWTRNSWEGVIATAPRFVDFFLSGYRLGWLEIQFGLRLKRGGELIEYVISDLLLDKWIMRGGAALIMWWVAKNIGILNYWVSYRIDHSVQRTVGVSAKVLQLIQSGNIQWYLFVAIPT